MRRPHPSPAACDRYKDFWQFPDKSLLLIRSENEISVTLGFRRKRREYATAHAEIDSPHMRTFLRAFKTQRDPLEVRGGHSYRFLRDATSMPSSVESRLIVLTEDLWLAG